jgi:hypothetical protein
MNTKEAGRGILVAVTLGLACVIAVSGCGKCTDEKASSAEKAGKDLPPADKMAEALKAVRWIESKEGSRHIVSPWGKVGKDGRIDYRALLKEKDIQALARIGVTPKEFVAGMGAFEEHPDYAASVNRSLSAGQ